MSPKDQCAGKMTRVPAQGFLKASDELMADALHFQGLHIGRETEGEGGILVVQKAHPLQHDILQARIAQATDHLNIRVTLL
jgi:hypothetical protein